MVTSSDKMTESASSRDGYRYPRLRGSFIRNSYQWLRNPYTLLDAARKDCGPTFEARLPVVGKVLITGDPDLIRSTIKNRQLVGGRGTRALRPLIGNDTLIVCDGKAHTARKQLLSSAFQPQSVRRHDQLTIDCCLHEIEKLPRNEPFSIFQVVRRITLQSIILSLFGDLEQPRRELLTGLINDYMHAFRNPLFLFVKMLQQDWGKFSPWGRLQHRRERLSGFVKAEILRHRQQQSATGCVLAEMVLNSKKSRIKISDESIFNEILGLLLFGHDTSAVSLAWLFCHIHSRPEIIHKLTAEIASVSIGDCLDDTQPNFLRCCIMESMRLCPVVVHLTRVATDTTDLGAFQLEKGDKVLPSAYLAQRDPVVFPEPDQFLPERFANGEDYGDSYFPFGFGARKCIGEHLAMQQMQIILYCFTEAVDLELEPGYTANPERKMLLIGPTGGGLLRIREAG